MDKVIDSGEVTWPSTFRWIRLSGVSGERVMVMGHDDSWRKATKDEEYQIAMQNAEED